MQEVTEKFRLRVAYKKEGCLAYLSHLEVARALMCVVRRANLPFMVSNGFSPKMKISFGAALGVGIGSDCEIFDLYMNRYVSPDLALRTLQKVSPRFLCPYDAYYVDLNSPAASNLEDIVKYEACVDYEIESLIIPDAIEVQKKRKSSIINVDKYLAKKPILNHKDKRTFIDFELSTSKSGSIKPLVLTQEILKASNINPDYLISLKKIK